MRNLFLLVTFLFSSVISLSQEDSYAIELSQQRQAAHIIRLIEKNSLDSVYKYLDVDYMKKQQKNVRQVLAHFYQEYTALQNSARRSVTVVLPEGFTLFRFRYFDSTGTVLQMDLSYRRNEILSKVQMIEIVDKDLFAQRRQPTSSSSEIIIGRITPTEISYPKNTIIEFRNCSKEMRTATFSAQLVAFKKWVTDNGSIGKNKRVKFSGTHHVDTTIIKANLNKLRNSLPKNFWNFSDWGEKYDHEPNEPAIWFMHIYCTMQKDGHVKIYAAYKVTFDGKDATRDIDRMDPKIIGVDFIFDKIGLAAIESQLKHASKVN